MTDTSYTFPQPSRAQFLKGALYGLFCSSIWAGWILITSTGVKLTLTAYDVTALRFFVAGVIFLPVLLKQGISVGKQGWLRISLMTIGGGGLLIYY